MWFTFLTIFHSFAGLEGKGFPSNLPILQTYIKVQEISIENILRSNLSGRGNVQHISACKYVKREKYDVICVH